MLGLGFLKSLISFFFFFEIKIFTFRACVNNFPPSTINLATMRSFLYVVVMHLASKVDLLTCLMYECRHRKTPRE